MRDNIKAQKNLLSLEIMKIKFQNLVNRAIFDRKAEEDPVSISSGGSKTLDDLSASDLVSRINELLDEEIDQLKAELEQGK